MKKRIAGIDEAGRGPLAGPIITAAVILAKPIAGIADSKKLSSERREQVAKAIKKHAFCFAYGRAEVCEVENLNIHFATLLAMQRAIEALSVQPDEILVDGKFIPKIAIPCRAIINGDNLEKVIGAASILAKVLRDAEMRALDLIYPEYGFAQHKGYGTPQHFHALKAFGPCPIHRKTFAPVAAIL